MRVLILLALLASIGAACADTQPPAGSGSLDSTHVEPAVEDGSDDAGGVEAAIDTSAMALVAAAERVADLLSRKDWNALSDLVHPRQGVRFSPYGTVDTAQHVRLLPAQLTAAAQDSTERLWGYYDGTGEPIDTSFSAYVGEFVVDKDFLQGQRGQPGERLGQGNTLNNIQEAFGTEAQFVEYYLPGTEPYDGMDWTSLRLVFAPYEGRWRLIGIVHDEWTI